MKINEKNLAAFAVSSNLIDKEGYLMKKGEGSKGFSKRWFVLKGNLLFYFDKKSDREPFGVIILEGSTVELAESEVDEHFCFKIVFPSKSYLLGAESQRELEQWMKALACASYDYVKLMAEELQRQLDELSQQQQSLVVQPSYLEATTYGSLEGSASSSRKPQHQQQNHMPTPPPRQRSKNQRLPQPRRTFESLHTEFGMKILHDQNKRWNGGVERPIVPPLSSPSQLSVVKQDTLITL